MSFFLQEVWIFCDHIINDHKPDLHQNVTVVLGDTSILLLNQHIKTHKVPKDVY